MSARDQIELANSISASLSRDASDCETSIGFRNPSTLQATGDLIAKFHQAHRIANKQHENLAFTRELHKSILSICESRKQPPKTCLGFAL